MSLTLDDSRALADAWYSRGGQIIRQMLSDQAREPQDELYEIMSKRPDTLTGKTALKYAIRAKALNDFKESIEDELKTLNPVGAGK